MLCVPSFQADSAQQFQGGIQYLREGIIRDPKNVFFPLNDLYEQIRHMTDMILEAYLDI